MVDIMPTVINEIIGSLIRIIFIFCLVRVPLEAIVKTEYKRRIIMIFLFVFTINLLVLISIYGFQTYISYILIYDLIGLVLIFLIAWFELVQTTGLINLIKRPYLRWPIGIIVWFVTFAGLMNLFFSFDPYYITALITSLYLAYLIVRKPR